MHRSRDDLVEAMKALLAPLSSQWVADQVGVKRQQVHHWKSGRYITEDRYADAMAAVRRLLAGQTKEAPPPWAEELGRKLDVLLARAGVDPATLSPDEAKRLIREALARASSTPRSSGGGTPAP
jgi:hypothetical protein